VKLDLAEAFHRIRIADGYQHLTAFKTRYGLFQYNVMPFGVANGPAWFQKYVDHALTGLTDNTCVSFFDDILIYGDTREEVVERTREVLARFRKTGLFVKLEKCSFHVQEVSFLGFKIGHGKVEMEPERVEAVRNWPKPSKLREVQEFLGFANFYRRFIQNYSRIAKGLTDLLRKTPGPFYITDEATKSFNNLKAAFCKYPVLRQFDSSKPIFVEPDASVYAVGAVLSQIDEYGRRHPVAYYSKKLTPEESRYGTSDQELLAVVYL
jgi:RNase H-like domain found in reverse transcriptase/Reverse transcriptase (RNA-dependent DNA polymerase)